MIALVDLHVHLLAGLDDGPKTPEDALRMCRIAYDQGVRMVAALAHQNEEYPEVTPDRIREATRRLVEDLHQHDIKIIAFPTAEVMAHPEMVDSWRAGKLLSMADRGQFLLVEMPHGLFIDLRAIVRHLREAGVRPILAHPERNPEMLYDPDLVEEFVRLGCLVQVSSGSITSPRDGREERALRQWLKRGVVHVLGSDGHSTRRRPPHMAAAYARIGHWAGSAAADRICSTNGMAILQGLPFRLPELAERRRSWFSRLW